MRTLVLSGPWKWSEPSWGLSRSYTVTRCPWMEVAWCPVVTLRPVLGRCCWWHFCPGCLRNSSHFAGPSRELKGASSLSPFLFSSGTFVSSLGQEASLWFITYSPSSIVHAWGPFLFYSPPASDLRLESHKRMVFLCFLLAVPDAMSLWWLQWEERSRGNRKYRGQRHELQSQTWAG